MRAKIVTTTAAVLTAAGIATAGAASAGTPSHAPTPPPAAVTAASTTSEGATQIRFAPGKSSGTVKGRVSRDAAQYYTFEASKGQKATIKFARSASATTWVLATPSGEQLHNAYSPRQSSYSTTLPETGRYTVVVASTRPATYDLTLSIPSR